MRLAAWLWRHFRPTEGRLIFLLLVLAVSSAAWGGAVAKWVRGDDLFWHVALVGVLLGRAFGRIRLRGGWTALLLGIGAVVYVGWSVTHLASPLWAALGTAWSKDWPLALIWLQEAGSRIAVLAGELVAWAGSWIGRGGVPGSVVTLFLMALLLWCGAAFAGWSVVRGRSPLIAFLPLGTALALSVFLGEKGTEHLLFFMACVVMMTPPMILRRQEQTWDSRQVPYSEEFRFDVRLVAVICAFIFVVAALLVPNVRVRVVVEWFWQRVSGPEQVAGEVLEQTFPGARPATWSGSRTAGAVLPREHLLGGSPDLQRTEVMLVAIGDPPPIVGEEVRPREVIYWRGTTYDEYVGIGWKQGRAEVVPLPAYAPLGPPELAGRRPLRQEFTLLVPHGDTLYAAGDPHSVDQAVTVRRLPGNGDLIALEGRADQYQVLSLIPRVSAEELASVPATYPPQIEETYLSLPPGVPQRVVDLAREVTAGVGTPYDRALALEAYLRTYPYDLEIAKPPEGRDVVDYFLFDLQRGYCDYFASAMVVMARSVGIPARLAVGYAMGHYEPRRGTYVVTEQDAHAWPELYFPGYGWIPFEPASGLGALERAEDTGELVLPLPALPSRPERSWWVGLQVEARLLWVRWRWWVLVGVGALAMVWIAWQAWRRRPPAVPSAEGRVALGYLRLRETASRLGVPVQPSDTPVEFAAAVQGALANRCPRRAWLGGMLRRDVERTLRGLFLLVRVYERVSYAPTRPGLELMQQAWQEGRYLPWRLLGVWALSRASD